MPVRAIGLDLARSIFQVRGVDAEGQAVLKRRIRRRDLLALPEGLPACPVGMEACSSAHHRARELVALGHDVRLLLPQYAKPCVKRNEEEERDRRGGGGRDLRGRRTTEQSVRADQDTGEPGSAVTAPCPLASRAPAHRDAQRRPWPARRVRDRRRAGPEPLRRSSGGHGGCERGALLPPEARTALEGLLGHVEALIARRPVNVAAVAVAHKTARAVRAKPGRGEAYRHPAPVMAA